MDIRSHIPHAGERYVQSMRQVPSNHYEYLLDLPSNMPEQHSTFYSHLQYIPFGVIDKNGNIWSTLLCHPKVNIIQSNRLTISTKISIHDPFVQAVISTQNEKNRYIAGVGVDFTNRRRNKLNGHIIRSNYNIDDNMLSLTIETYECMGNCPKYITIRKLIPKQRETKISYRSTSILNEEAKAILQQASTVFIASKHIDNVYTNQSDMGFNHRGGNPGFVRYYESNDTNSNNLIGRLVLPDYSGNMFYQSLGNIQVDSSIGIVVLDFHTGNSLHITGQAVNLYNEEASEIMPKSTLITVINISEAMVLQGSIQFDLINTESYSPYNPPIALLSSEMKEKGINLISTTNIPTAKLSNIVKNTAKISTFTFTLNPNSTNSFDLPRAGGYVILSFANVMNKYHRYQHMNELNPKSVNENYIRTWTISGSANNNISITVKRAGLLSSFLHSLTQADHLEVQVLGTGGEFSCFNNNLQLANQKMLWLIGGVGITPFLSMFSTIVSNHLPNVDIEVLYSCTDQEISFIDPWIKQAQSLGLKLNIQLFGSTLHSRIDKNVNSRRINEADIDNIIDLSTRTAYICGPQSFNQLMNSWLLKRVDSTKIKFESFDF